jgi:hypothetical protein
MEPTRTTPTHTTYNISLLFLFSFLLIYSNNMLVLLLSDKGKQIYFGSIQITSYG